MVKEIRLSVLIALLLVALYLLANRQLLDDNLYAMRRGQGDVSLDFKRLSEGLVEDEIRRLVPGVALRCDPLPENDRSLGDRACAGWIKSFNGIRAYQLAFFFRNGTLCNAKVDVPWWQHRRFGRHLLLSLGKPTGMQDWPSAGVRLMGWRLAEGNLLYNRDPSFNLLWWNTAFWVSPAEAATRGGIFVPAEAPEWREGRPLELAMKVIGVIFERW